jgi:hypothetical protein
MIKPTEKDIGRRVFYSTCYRGVIPEYGVITSLSAINEEIVFVKYNGDDHSKATYCQDLEWEND